MKIPFLGGYSHPWIPAILMWTTGVLLVLTHCHIIIYILSTTPPKKKTCLPYLTISSALTWSFFGSRFHRGRDFGGPPVGRSVVWVSNTPRSRWATRGVRVILGRNGTSWTKMNLFSREKKEHQPWRYVDICGYKCWYIYIYMLIYIYICWYMLI